jgi:predicted porin
METRTKNLILAVAATVAFICLMMWVMQPAHAADLGGNCCSDLEERVAELEAATARKGNHKVTLTVYGQIDAALSYASLGDFDGTHVVQNGNDESYVGFAGEARINPDLMAGYRLEIDLHQLGLANYQGNAEPRVRQSYWFIRSDKIGQLSVGRAAQATQDFDKINTSNAWVAGKPLSFGSLSDAYLTGIDAPFDGRYRDVVRYDSPDIAGFIASASWGASIGDGSIFGDDSQGNSWDVALRYAHEFEGIALAGGVGYRHDEDFTVNLLNLLSLTLPTGDVNTFLATASARHVATGLFATVNYAHQDWSDFDFTLEGINVEAGVQTKMVSLGTTTLFGEWGRFKLSPDGGSSGNIDYYGLGAVQAIDQAAMDLYLGYRHYDLGDLVNDNADAVTAGARINF